MKTQDIYKTIKNQIIEKKYNLGDRLPTEHELMAEFGVGRSTIREVLTNLTNEAIIEKRHGLGSYITRIPASKGTICICVRFENMISSTVWYPTLIKSIDLYAKSKGYDIIIAVGYGSAIKEINDSIDAFFRKPFSKEIVAIVNTMAFDLGEKSVPILNIDAMAPTSKNSIYNSYDEIITKSTELFAKYNYQKPTFVYMRDSKEKAGETIYNKMTEMVDSYKHKGWKELEITSYESCQETFDKWYKETQGKKAVLLQDDGILDNLIPYFYEKNIRIPEDLAVITYANTHKKFAYPIEFHRFGADHNLTAKAVIENLDILLNGKEVGIIKLDTHYHPGDSL